MLFADAAPVPKDVVIAVVGATAALGGLVLVFIGVMLPAYQQTLLLLNSGKEELWRDIDANPRGVEPADLQIFEFWRGIEAAMDNAFRAAALTLVLSLADLGLGVLWLALPGGRVVYRIALWLFFGDLASMLVLVLLVLPFVKSTARQP